VPTDPKPGEVWFAELGMIEKSRPVLVLAFPGSDDARALAVVAPLTSQIRGMRGEVDLGKPSWLPKHSAVNVQGLASFDHRKLTRRMGQLSPAQMAEVKTAIRDLLEL
jgi:mRNA-degrading endonuclease toxin of MazEF toxin-antitoxin module